MNSLVFFSATVPSLASTMPREREHADPPFHNAHRRCPPVLNKVVTHRRRGHDMPASVPVHDCCRFSAPQETYVALILDHRVVTEPGAAMSLDYRRLWQKSRQMRVNSARGSQHLGEVIICVRNQKQRAPQSSFAIISCLERGVKLSISRPRDANTGLMWGGTNLWFILGAMESS